MLLILGSGKSTNSLPYSLTMNAIAFAAHYRFIHQNLLSFVTWIFIIIVEETLTDLNINVIYSACLSPLAVRYFEFIVSQPTSSQIRREHKF